MYHAGFYETEITPPLGSIIPGGFAARYNTHILDPLWARAAVWELDGGTAAIVSLDACGVTCDITEKIRERVSRWTPIPPEAVMVCATHCHGGGPTLNWGEEVVRDEEYIQFFIRRAADAVVCAWQRRSDAVLTLGEGELPGWGFIRDFRMKDGSLKTNPGMGNPEIDTPLDEPDAAVTVLATYAGENPRVPMGALINYACHPAIVAGDGTSADYIGALSAALKREYGPEFVAVFVNGACGDVNHINPFDPATAAPGRHIALGQALAGAAAAVIRDARPLSPEGAKVGGAAGILSARIRKPDAAYLAAAKARYDALGDRLPDIRPGGPGYVEVFFALQAFQLQADRRVFRELPLQVLQIGEARVYGSPCQIFTAFGRRIKGSAAPRAMVSAFANDYGGYVPTPQAMRPGIYEARLASTSMLAADTGDRLCDALLALGRELEK